ncbi:MAG: hypothetical protein PHQ50_00205 [Eubacteriales bacterium]|nr:hypothetical protein [Eubacteriales bacterium]MDD3349291.1 hypothetical protein [Eubacteriales bacterium]
MEKIKLLIISEDSEYAVALSRLLSIKYDCFRIDIKSGKTNTASIEKCRSAFYDLLLYDRCDEAYEQSLLSEDQSKCVLLTEEESFFRKDENDEDSNNKKDKKQEQLIYKYAGADKIASDLQLFYMEATGKTKKTTLGTGAELILFSGAAGNVGKTALCIATARELAEFHRKKVLLLSFESPESFGFYLDEEGKGRGLNEYLYYLFAKYKQYSPIDPAAFLTHDRFAVDYFRPGNSINELIELSLADLRDLLASVANFKAYEYICCDVSCFSLKKYFELLSLADRIIHIDDGSPLSIYKNEALLNAYYLATEEENSDRLIRVRNKWQERKASSVENNIDLFIEYDPESFRATTVGLEIEMDRCFGLGVKKLAEKIRRQI